MLTKWNRLARWLTANLLAAALLLGSAVPVLAEEAPAAPHVLQISQWALAELHDGEKTDIFPLEWYYTFQQTITPEQLTSLLQRTSAKIDELGFPKKAESPIIPVTSGTVTRGDVTESLFSLLASYDLPSAFGWDDGSEAAAFLQERGIIAGTGRGLELDKPSTLEQAAVMASRLVHYAYATADAGARGLMWVVSHEGNTLYLLGSIHIGIPEMYPLHRSVRDTMLASDALIVEANTLNGNPEAMQAYLNYMMAEEGKTLQDYLSAESYAKLQNMLNKIGLLEQAFDPFKPWYVSNQLSLFSLMDRPEDLTYAAMRGIDSYFLGWAVLTGMPVMELEGIQFQSELLAGGPIEQQAEQLDQLLDALLDEEEVAKTSAMFRQMQLEWANGNLDGFRELFIEGGQLKRNESSQQLLGERDQAMAEKLAELLEAEGEATYFVVVGAAHYAIDGMVVDLLRERGYDVQFIE